MIPFYLTLDHFTFSSIAYLAHYTYELGAAHYGRKNNLGSTQL